MAGEPVGGGRQTGGREPWWAYAYLAAVLAIAVGLLGAGAFHPDDGSLLRSEALWRVFGLTAYGGFAVIYLLVLVAAGRLVLWLGRRVRRAHERTS